MRTQSIWQAVLSAPWKCGMHASDEADELEHVAQAQIKDALYIVCSHPHLDVYICTLQSSNLSIWLSQCHHASVLACAIDVSA